jgi:hypothetical protein
MYVQQRLLVYEEVNPKVLPFRTEKKGVITAGSNPNIQMTKKSLAYLKIIVVLISVDVKNKWSNWDIFFGKE